jgi:hypothetical protein
LINKIAKLALKAGQTQRLEIIDEGIVRQIGLRFDRVSKAVPPERRDHVRDVASTVRGKPGVIMVAEEQASMPPPTSAAPLSGVDAPVVRPDNAGNLGEEVAPVVMTSDQQTKQALMEDMIKFPERYN